MENYQKIVRGIALLDLVLSLPLTIPKSALFLFSAIFMLNDFCGFNTVNINLDIFHIFLINLMGIVCVLWASVRIIHPTYFLSMADSCCRIYLSIIICYYVIYKKISPVLLFFVFTELIGAVIQFMGYLTMRKIKYER
ncbi:conserved membrane hypothetical protein [Candidatus Magnetomoraceae bacterium gMMP-15]